MFEKIIFPELCKNNVKPKPSIIRSSDEIFDRAPSLLNDSRNTSCKIAETYNLNSKKTEKENALARRHYYHVICYDLINEAMHKEDSQESRKNK